MKNINDDERDCPKCKAESALHRMGIWRNEVKLNVNEEGSPEYFEDELTDYKIISGEADEYFWECEECDYIEKITLKT
jgi:hypothetical protein